MGQGGAAFAGALRRYGGYCVADDFGGVFGVLVQDGYDLVHRYGVVGRVPAVVVGDHGYRDVADLGLACELGFLQVGHADYIGAPATVEIGFGFGGELRALHADVGSASLADYSDFLAGGFDDLGHFAADWVAETYVGDDASAEEGGDALGGAVEELVGHDEVGGFVFFLQRTDC